MDPWVGKISWRRKWQPTPVCLPGKSTDRDAQATVWGVTESYATEQSRLSVGKSSGKCLNTASQGDSLKEQKCWQCPQGWVVSTRSSSI